MAEDDRNLRMFVRSTNHRHIVQPLQRRQQLFRLRLTGLDMQHVTATSAIHEKPSYATIDI
jgi:hypothetical protein